MKILSLILAASFFLFTASAQAEEYTVKMITDKDKGTYYFEPEQLTVKSGDTVTWINAQDDIHEVMSESVPEGAQAFESPTLDKKDQKWSHTFTQSGTYRYHCHPHVELKMRGVIIVDKPSEVKETQQHGNHDHTHKPSSLTAVQATEYLQAGKPVYSCPMHTHVFSDASGPCPICGMNLMPVKEVKDGQAVMGEQDMEMPMMESE